MPKITKIEFDVGGDNEWGVDNIEYGQYPTDPVPEPATMLLLGSGLLGFAGFKRRVKRNRNHQEGGNDV